MKKHIKIINGVLIVAILCVLTLEMHVLTRAQSAADTGDTGDAAGAEEFGVDLDKPNRCVTFLKPFMAEKQIEFGEFMNQHFRSPKPTSELIEVAVERYRQYREEVRAEMLRLSQPTGGQSTTAIVPERAVCEEAMNEDFAIMIELMKQHISQNAFAKKSTRLLDKYKEINSKLDKLNFTIAQMYGYFGALSQKLPCYATQCVRG